MEIPASRIAISRETCLVRDHRLPNQYYPDTMDHNIRIYSPNGEHAGKSFIEVYGHFFDNRCSVNFLCHAIMAKIQIPEPRDRFRTLVFDSLSRIASDVLSHPASTSAQALGLYTDATYTGKDAEPSSPPLTHCIWFSAEHKYRKSTSIELKDATVQHLLLTLKPRIERAISVVTAASCCNAQNHSIDREILLRLNTALTEVDALIVA